MNKSTRRAAPSFSDGSERELIDHVEEVPKALTTDDNLATEGSRNDL